VPGAVLAGVAWTALQFLGSWLVARQLQHSSELYGFFAIVLGLLFWLFLAAQILVYSAEVNVVLARRLWPRSLRTLFVDRGELTEADRRAYAGYVRAQQHKQAEIVDVSFKHPDTGELQTVEEPGPRGKAKRSRRGAPL
jgi:membrane protein